MSASVSVHSETSEVIVSIFDRWTFSSAVCFGSRCFFGFAFCFCCTGLTFDFSSMWCVFSLKLARSSFETEVPMRDTGGPGSLLRYLRTRSVRAVAVNTVTHEHDVEHEQTVGFLM